MRKLESFVQTLADQGFTYELKKEDGIPFLQVYHKDFRLMTITAAMAIARQLKDADPGIVRFHAMDGQGIDFMIYPEDLDVTTVPDNYLYGTDVEAWLTGVLGS